MAVVEMDDTGAVSVELRDEADISVDVDMLELPWRVVVDDRRHPASESSRLFIWTVWAAFSSSHGSILS